MDFAASFRYEEGLGRTKDDAIEAIWIVDDDAPAVPQQTRAAGMREFVDAVNHREPAIGDANGRRPRADFDGAPVCGRQHQPVRFDDGAERTQIGARRCERYVPNRDPFALAWRKGFDRGERTFAVCV